MRTLNEEMKKIKRLFDYKKGDVITEGEDKSCDCPEGDCICEGAYIYEDSEGEETFNYGEDEGHDHKEEEHLEEEMSPHDRIKEIRKHLDALESDMSYDEDHEDRDEEGTDFAEGKKYSKVLKTLSESQVKTLKRFVKIPLNEDSLTYVEKIDNVMKSLERVVNSEVGESHEELRSVLDHSEVSKSMDTAKHCLMKSIESLKDKFKKKKEKKNESKKYSKVLKTLNESQVRKLKRFVK